jgi:hypothetical protein
MEQVMKPQDPLHLLLPWVWIASKSSEAETHKVSPSNEDVGRRVWGVLAMGQEMDRGLGIDSHLMILLSVKVHLNLDPGGKEMRREVRVGEERKRITLGSFPPKHLRA